MEKIGLEAFLKTEAFQKGVDTYLSGLSKIEGSTERMSRQALSLKGADGAVLKMSTSFSKVSQTSQQAEKTVGGFNRAVGKMSQGINTTNQLLGAFGLAIGVREVVNFTAASHEMARAQNDARNTLTNLLGSAGAYRSAIDEARTATRNTISETDTARAVFGLLDNQIASNSTQAAQYVLAGKALEASLGAQTASFEKYLMLLDQGSPMLLNNFNITDSMVEAQQRLVEANTNLTGSQARLQAIRELALEKGLALANGISAETVAAQQASAAFADFQASFGQLIISIDQSVGITQGAISAFNALKQGADAWRYVITEAIPANQNHKSSLAADAAQAILTAQSYDEAAAATNDAERDIEAFQEALLSNVSSHQEYQAAVDKVAESNIFLAGQLDLTVEEFDKTREAITQAAAEAVVASGQWVSSVEAMGIATSTETAKMVEGLERAAQAQQTLAQFTPQTNRQRDAYTQYYTAMGSQSEIQTNFQIEEEKRKSEEAQKSAQEMQKAQEQAAKKGAKAMVSAFQQAANELKGVIESAIKPTLDEVWKPPEDAPRMDEAARRLATVATSGFQSEWLNQLATQFQGQEFFQPVVDAMQSGDEGALKEAATTILQTQVAKLWDVNLIKEQVRQQLQQQQLKENIIGMIEQELSAEGVTATFEGITVASDDTQTALGELGNTMTDAEASTTAFQDALAGGLGTASEQIKTFGDEVKEADWQDVGASIVEGIQKGIEENISEVKRVLRELAKEAIAAAQDELGAHSPAAEFIPLGSSIPQGLAAGVDESAPSFLKKLRKMIGFSSQMVASGMINETQRRNVTRVFDSLLPGMADQFGAGSVSAAGLQGVVNQQLKAFNIPPSVVGQYINFQGTVDNLTQSFQELHFAQRLAAAPAHFDMIGKFMSFQSNAVDKLNKRIEHLRILAENEGGLFEGQTISALDAQEKLNQALTEQASIQNEINQMNRQQAQLDFLRQQVDMLTLAKEQGLDVEEIFQGIQLGADASIPDLVKVTSKIIQAMLDQADEDLEIGSPSKAMFERGYQTGAGFAQGLAYSEKLLGAAIQTPILKPVLGGGGGGSSRVVNLYFGDTNISGGQQGQQFIQQVRLAVTQAIQ